VAIPDDPPGDIARLFAFERRYLLELPRSRVDHHRTIPPEGLTEVGFTVNRPNRL